MCFGRNIPLTSTPAAMDGGASGDGGLIDGTARIQGFGGGTVSPVDRQVRVRHWILVSFLLARLLDAS